MAKKVARMEFDLTVEIDGSEYRCADVSTSFALNRIPSARCNLAIGREARYLERAKVHDTADQLNTMKPTKIRLIPKGEWRPEDGDIPGFAPGEGRWTEAGPQVIFDGYLTGTGWRKQRGRVRYGISLIHWLSDLSFSSSFSNQSHPGNPTRFRWRASFGPQGTRTGTKGHFITGHVSNALFTPGNIQNDLWKEVLHKMFCEMSKQDALSKFGPDACVGLGGANTEAQNALKRIEVAMGDRDEVGADCEAGSKSPYFKALKMELGSIPEIIAKSISFFCRHRTVEGYFHSTIWDNIVGILGPSLMFAVVPRVETAMIVPFVPGLRTTFDEEFGNGKVLDVKDITYIDVNSFIPRPLRAVGVLQGGTSSRTGVHDRVPLKVLGGCFACEEVEKGMVIYKPPPRWLENAPAHGHRMKKTALADRPGSSTTPVAPGSAEGDDNGETPASATNKAVDYYKRVAKYYYAQEMLRGRHAAIQGKLRFDLAPGTSVKIQNQDPIHIEGDKLAADLVGSISRVGCVINAEAANAGTAFHLEYVRTAEENQSDCTSIENHPLYKTQFSGAPLLHEYLFKET